MRSIWRATCSMVSAKSVVSIDAFGDQQMPNVSTEVLARILGTVVQAADTIEGSAPPPRSASPSTYFTILRRGAPLGALHSSKTESTSETSPSAFFSCSMRSRLSGGSASRIDDDDTSEVRGK